SGYFLRCHRVARRISSTVRSALVGPAGNHGRPERLIANECQESRIDDRAALPVFAVASRAIALEDGLAVLRVARVRAIWRQSNSNKISWSGPMRFDLISQYGKLLVR